MTHALLLAAATAIPAPCDRDPVMTTAVPARVPKDSQGEIEKGQVVTVKVSLDAAGHVTNAEVYRGTGISTVDDAAVYAAKTSTYAPAYAACKPVEDTFLVNEVIIPDAGTPGGSCGIPYKPAEVVKEVYVESPRQLPQTTGTTTVEVTIGPKGDVKAARLLNSSGIKTFDDAALESARRSTYTPKIVDCKPVTGTFLMKITYGVIP